jgi:hypothetical protein
MFIAPVYSLHPLFLLFTSRPRVLLDLWLVRRSTLEVFEGRQIETDHRGLGGGSGHDEREEHSTLHGEHASESRSSDIAKCSKSSPLCY